jgi:nucleoside-diphosphate-sugar epimerase
LNLLLLGGTRFLGRHIVDVALARDHRVTIFTRGREANPWGARVDARFGNRDSRIAPGLATLDHGTWDAVVDTSGYVPRVVGASADLMRERVGRYLFVSSLSAYASSSDPGQDECAPLAPPVATDNEEIPKNYGALKASCEAVVAQRFDARATIVRPGLIVGPFDPTDRFSYWVARFVHPTLLGDRAERAVVPAPRKCAIQFIDVRDLAEWIVALLENDVGGTFNAVSPSGAFAMGDLIDALIKASRTAPAPAWIDEATLLAHRVEPWIGLPLWIPATDADAAGFMHFAATKALRAGLRIRTLAATIEDTAAWLVARDNAGAWKNVLDGATERAILGAFDAPKRS